MRVDMIDDRNCHSKLLVVEEVVPYQNFDKDPVNERQSTIRQRQPTTRKTKRREFLTAFQFEFAAEFIPTLLLPPRSNRIPVDAR